MKIPSWIDETVALCSHEESLAKQGGAEGVRDMGLLESALKRPQNLWHYSDPKPDTAALAASLAHGIAKNHPFFDGNKRTAWMLCRLMLRLNRCDIQASDNEKYDAMLALAAGEWSEEEFAAWLRSHLV